MLNLAEYRQLKVTFDHKDVLSVQHLDIQAGKRYAVVGPSGSGKSTFLRLTNLLELPSSGSLKLFEEPFSEKGYTRSKQLHIQRQMVYVSQKPIMFDMTVEENIAMGLKYRKMKKSQSEERIEEVLNAVGLAGYAKRRATTLSGGEAQRIALARALVIEPKLLLLDEPTSNLDPINIEIIENAVNQIHDRIGVTVVMVTHNLQQAKRIGDEIIFINQGKVFEKQKKDQFFESPPVQEMADFISGRMIY
ncbi:phosphate ABC transporter ATP-binding protein [Ammoniphilus sp. 3BR4]|uniref:ABC transporter ATP-binding protein n=1 Tax=Ammoniphilus sp. 3BR4 TaxID=3158265 RepID=UPI00346744AE